jgi:uncharacterized protein YcbK (DUF882 family)
MATRKQLTRNFTIEEFDCKDGTPVPAQYENNVTKLAQNLQALRDHLKEPVRITGSGYRTPRHNRAVGGASNSQHLFANGADINVKSRSPRQLATIIEKLIKEGKMEEGGIGVYKGFLHYDRRGTKARWRA